MPDFWAVARAKTQATYDAALDKLWGKKAEAAAYLEAAEPETWAEALFLGWRYGHDTSNIMESLNQVIKLNQELSVLELLDSLWHQTMEKWADHLVAVMRALGEGCWGTPFLEGKLMEQRLWACSNTMMPSSPTQAHVQQPNNRVMLVDLEAGTCSCRRYQENGIPCGHAMTFIFATGQDLLVYLPPVLSAEVWQQSYATPMPPVDISELTVSNCLPPVTRSQRTAIGLRPTLR